VHLADGDAHHPGAEQPWPLELGQALEGDHEAVLRHVLGLGAAPEQARGDRQHRRRVPAVELFLGPRLGAQGGGDQGRVIGARAGQRWAGRRALRLQQAHRRGVQHALAPPAGHGVTLSQVRSTRPARAPSGGKWLSAAADFRRRRVVSRSRALAAR
jgi:hypothetical protein